MTDLGTAGAARPGLAQRTLQRLAFAASVAWGLVLALFALGAGLIQSFGFLGFVATAFCAWLWVFVRAVRSEHGRARTALFAIAWSPVWPAAALVSIVRARGRPRIAEPKLSAVAAPAQPPPERAPRPAPVPPKAAPIVPPLSRGKAALALAGLLVGMLATYVAAALFFVLWAVLSGIHWITPGVTRFVAIGAGVIVAGGFFAVGDFWRRRAPAS
jgi:hypothetical protein